MAEQDNIDPHFMGLLFSLQATAMAQMGKTVSSETGNVERNLPMSKQIIDLIEMLERKTKGNLTGDEGKLISNLLYELRLNYVDELKKGDSSEQPIEGKG